MLLTTLLEALYVVHLLEFTTHDTTTTTTAADNDRMSFVTRMEPAEL